MKHSTKMMWGCVALVGVAGVLALAGANVPYGLLAFPCILMMGAMVWMMTRGMGGGSHGSG